MSWTDRAADRLIDLAIRLAPEARRSWLLAMRAELPYIPRKSRLGFAVGATKVALTERTIEMKHLASRPLEGLILLAAAFLALATTGNGIHQFSNDPVVAASFCALALTWSSAFFATLLGRYRLLAKLACGGGALSLIIGLASSMLAQVPVANVSLMRGLAIEGMFLFAVLFGAASLALRKIGQAH